MGDVVEMPKASEATKEPKIAQPARPSGLAQARPQSKSLSKGWKIGLTVGGVVLVGGVVTALVLALRKEKKPAKRRRPALAAPAPKKRSKKRAAPKRRKKKPLPARAPATWDDFNDDDFGDDDD